MDTIPRTSGIYQITCTPTGKIYIGSAANLSHRHHVHMSRLQSHIHENTYLQHAWDKYGADAFEFTVIELVLSSFRLEREQYWLDKLQPYDRAHGFNISVKAGAPMAGRKHTQETRDRLRITSAKHRHTEETKRMMSERNKGKVFGVQTESSRQKRADARRGMKHTPETIQKMQESARRVQTSARSYIVTTPEGEELVITNLSRFCEEHALSLGCMRNIAAGHAKQHQGYRCRYPED
jgi:group I intron endonuclease